LNDDIIWLLYRLIDEESKRIMLEEEILTFMPDELIFMQKDIE
jgi:hypothetical protein